MARGILARVLAGGLVVAAAQVLAPTVMSADAPPWSPNEVSVFQNDKGFQFMNDYGAPFFSNDADVGGKVGCGDACTGVEWIPVFKIQEISKPQGEWTIVIRPDKAPQWAYKGKPIYSHVGHEGPDEVLKIAAESGGHWHVVTP